MVYSNGLLQIGRVVGIGCAFALITASDAQAVPLAGQATGFWNNPNTVFGVNDGDPFTATFTYDDAAMQTTTSSSGGNIQLTYQVALASLLFESGQVTQTFTSGSLSGVVNSNPSVGETVNLFGDFDGEDKSASLTIAKIFTGDSNTSSSVANFFITPKSSAGGNPVNAIANFTGVTFDSIQFSGVPDSSAAIPEPTTMLGVAIAGFGLGWLKRKQHQ